MSRALRVVLWLFAAGGGGVALLCVYWLAALFAKGDPRKEQFGGLALSMAVVGLTGGLAFAALAVAGLYLSRPPPPAGRPRG